MNKSHHMMPTSANLLGFTFLVLASIKGLGLSKVGITDEVTGVCVVIFAVSTLFSFLSIRSEDERSTTMFEQLADFSFLLGLVLCVALSILLVTNVVKLSA